MITKNKKIKINVTSEDIILGKSCDGNKCPVARAALRKFKLKPNSILFVDEVENKREKYVIRIHNQRATLNEYALPGIANGFISKFDSGEKVKPFSFILGKRLS